MKIHLTAERILNAPVEITEPVPGRVLVESGPGVETTFTVEPEGDDRALSPLERRHRPLAASTLCSRIRDRHRIR